MKKIVLTGGGTAGHVNPNIALMPGLKERGFEIFYIGSHQGIEKRLIGDTDVPYFSVATGKLRRYFSVKNATDLFRVVKGVGEAKKILRTIKPDVIFSKGGFVSVPVVRAASKLGIPVIIHESDATPGLANRISFKYTSIICASFPETMDLLPSQKARLTGSPIRESLASGSREGGLKFAGLKGQKPVLTIMGGSSGAAVINAAVREGIHELLERYDIIHLCGAGNMDESLKVLEGYSQFEYVGAELSDVFAATDMIVSRAGANAIFELLSLRIPNLLIPLGAGSRGDQVINAKSFEKSGYSRVLLQDDLSKETLIKAIEDLYESRDELKGAMEGSPANSAVSRILDLIEETAK